MTHITQAPETKASSADMAFALDDFRTAFEAFRATNDERLSQMETRFGGDVVTEEKLARIDGALDEARQIGRAHV